MNSLLKLNKSAEFRENAAYLSLLASASASHKNVIQRKIIDFFSDMKMNIVDAQNACLSGGVAVGAIAHFMMQPYGAILIGSAAGIISTVGYQIIQVCIIQKIISDL